MPIFVELLQAGQPAVPPTGSVVRAGVPERDGCRILNRFKAFVVNQGVVATLEHVFRDNKGRPQALGDFFGQGTPGLSLSSASAGAGTHAVKLRVKDWLGVGVSSAVNPIYEFTGQDVDPANGVVQVELDADVVEQAGIYELAFAIVDANNRPVLTDRGILSIERSLWPSDLMNVFKNLGPPTLQEVRMRLMDSAAADNFLLEEVEFSDDEVLLALAEPVRAWNEALPPIEIFNTRNFPFRGAWISGVLAQLHLMAGNRYRRNRLAHSAGGVTVDDLNKEREYMAEGQRLWQEYIAWMTNKKVSLNISKFWGSSPSTYSLRAGW